jgi:hypothetical protein
VFEHGTLASPGRIVDVVMVHWSCAMSSDTFALRLVEIGVMTSLCTVVAGSMLCSHAAIVLSSQLCLDKLRLVRLSVPRQAFRLCSSLVKSSQIAAPRDIQTFPPSRRVGAYRGSPCLVGSD